VLTMSDVDAQLLTMLAGPPEKAAGEGGEGDEDEGPEEIERKMEEARALNAQLRALLPQLEREQRQQQQRALAARPSPPRAKKGGWGGTTHTDMRAQEIAKENAILVGKLSTVAVRSSGLSTGPVFRPPPSQSSIAINNRRKNDQIARENAAMAKRLNSVKATSTISSKNAAKHAQQHARLTTLISGRPPTQGPSYTSALSQPQPLAQPLPPRSRGRQSVTPQLVPRRAPFQL